MGSERDKRPDRKRPRVPTADGADKESEAPAPVLSPAGLRALQSKAGNAAVSGLLHEAGVAGRRTTDPLQASPAHNRLPARGPIVRRLPVQRSFTGDFPTKLGKFRMDMITKNDAPKAPSGMRGTIKFEPDPKGPYTNKLGLVQIVKLTDDKAANVNPVSLPTTTAPKVRTKADKAKGVEGDFFTDVLHQDPFKDKKKPPIVAKQGSAVSPYYPFSSKGGQTFGFRRSEKAADIQAAELFDFPGTTSTTAGFDFSFETVAKGDDNLLTYGAVKWAFQLRKGKVQNETSSVSEGTSATFDAALEKHREFYVHEPVTVYFDFAKDTLEAAEAAKIDTFLGYLKTNPDVKIQLTGFADQTGGMGTNQALSLRRAKGVAAALEAKGVDKARISPPKAKGETTGFTKGAKTKQTDEANRKANRRVMIEFSHPPKKKGP